MCVFEIQNTGKENFLVKKIEENYQNYREKLWKIKRKVQEKCHVKSAIHNFRYLRGKKFAMNAGETSKIKV